MDSCILIHGNEVILSEGGGVVGFSPGAPHPICDQSPIDYPKALFYIEFTEAEGENQ
jgi:hypothetical protein